MEFLNWILQASHRQSSWPPLLYLECTKSSLSPLYIYHTERNVFIVAFARTTTKQNRACMSCLTVSAHSRTSTFWRCACLPWSTLTILCSLENCPFQSCAEGCLERSSWVVILNGRYINLAMNDCMKIVSYQWSGQRLTIANCCNISSSPSYTCAVNGTWSAGGGTCIISDPLTGCRRRTGKLTCSKGHQSFMHAKQLIRIRPSMSPYIGERRWRNGNTLARKSEGYPTGT